MAAAQGTRSRSSSLDRPEDYPSARRDSLRRAVDPDPGLAPPTKRLRAGHEVEAGPQERETRFHSASSHDRPSENASSQLPPIVTREERHGTGDRHSWSPSTPYQIDAAGEPRAGMRPAPPIPFPGHTDNMAARPPMTHQIPASTFGYSHPFQAGFPDKMPVASHDSASLVRSHFPANPPADARHQTFTSQPTSPQALQQKPTPNTRAGPTFAHVGGSQIAGAGLSGGGVVQALALPEAGTSGARGRPSNWTEEGEPSQRRRGKLPQEVTDLLKTWLMAHTIHPYPSEEEKKMLCEQTKLTMSQVSNWFINARRRILIPPSEQSPGQASQGGHAVRQTQRRPPIEQLKQSKQPKHETPQPVGPPTPQIKGPANEPPKLFPARPPQPAPSKASFDFRIPQQPPPRESAQGRSLPPAMQSTPGWSAIPGRPGPAATTFNPVSEGPYSYQSTGPSYPHGYGVPGPQTSATFYSPSAQSGHMTQFTPAYAHQFPDGGESGGR